MSSTTETGLSTAQGNALVYSSLSAFLLVGLYAGYRTKTKVDFLSGIRTQSAFPLALNWIASNMSSSLFFGYPQLAVIPQAGILGLAAYAFSSCVPLFAFAFLGPYIRRICPEGFTLAEFIRQRFGLPVGILASVIFVAFMLCFMITELNTFGGVVNLLGGVNPTISALIVAITTTIYTAYGGFKASLWTDNVNAIVIAIFVIMMCVAVGVEVNIDTSRISESGLLKPQRLGGELWYILTVAIVFSQMFNQGFWQRAFASKTNQVLWKSVLIAVVPLFAIIFLIGMAGPIAQWAGLFNGPTAEDDGSYTFFYLLSTLPTWVHGIVIVLAGALTSSAYDTLQSAQISTIQNDVFVGKVNIWWCRLVLLLLNIPAVVLAVKNVDILEVFLIADLGAASVLPAPLLGLIPGLYWLNGFDVFIGAIGGFFTVFIFGTIFYHGDAYAGVSLIALPQGLYIEDYSVLGAFFAAPLGSIGWTFVAFAFRALITLAWCRFRGQEYKVFERKEWDTRKFALDEDRPAELKNGEEGDENRLGLESTTSDDVHKDGGESKSDEVLDGGFLHSNKDHDFSFEKLKQKLFNRNGGSQ